MERLYGIQNGGSGFYGNRYSKNLELPQNAKALTQEDLATKLGISVDALQRYKTLAEMIPELDDLVRDGKVGKIRLEKFCETKGFSTLVGKDDFLNLLRKSCCVDLVYRVTAFVG